ncbi:beta-ketoacyl-ACP synthase III [Desulfogranum mediterraneum]|uniref:beta-ketoacyl-ACP synthase III n=1 Tax=Desulfogranum mediterraneum TaxID=160661 RepID=UPI000423622B|nr:beta-ketoacyl-ACP synthase III [Desulfogranum mediterraneum]
MCKAVILGTGSCLPERTLTNAELEQMVETSDQWITSRTGIKTRRISGAGEYNYRLAAGAGRKALDNAGLTAAELDMIIVATLSPQKIMPSTACFVQAELGADNAFAYDINAACTGFTYGLDLASKYIASQPEMKVLVIGSETLSTRVDWEDRNTCVLFGDGAGAAVLGSRDDGRGIFGSKLRSDGRLWNLLHMDGPESQNPALQPEDWQGALIRMNGSDIFKHAVRAMSGVVNDLLEQQGLSVADVDLIIPHQANIRILRKLQSRLDVPDEKLFVNVDKYGNTSAASIPIALDEANQQGRIKENDVVLLCTFGAGLTWASLLMRW